MKLVPDPYQNASSDTWAALRENTTGNLRRSILPVWDDVFYKKYTYRIITDLQQGLSDAHL